MIRQSLNQRHSIAQSQIIRTGATGGGSSSAYLRNTASAGTPDGLTIAYDANGLLGLNSSGATDGQTWVYDAVDGWELRTVPSGTGLANRMAKWTGTGTLSYGPLVTETGTIGLGVGVTSEPTDTFFYINVGATAGFSGMRIESSAITNDTPALVIESASLAGGMSITQTNSGAASAPAPALTLTNTHATLAKGLEVVLTGATNPASRGIAVTMPSLSGGVGLEVIDNGGGGAIRATGSGDYTAAFSALSGANATVPLRLSTASASTARTLEMEANGAAEGIFVTRTNSSATAALVNLLHTGGSQTGIALTHGSTGIGVDVHSTLSASANPALKSRSSGTAEAGYFVITNAANAAPAMYATTDGSGEAIEGVNSGTGMGAHLRITNGDSTADVLKCETAGNGRMGYFYRNVSGATADGLTVHLDHAADAGTGLKITHDGTGAGIVITSSGTGVAVASSGAGLTAGLHVSYSGSFVAANFVGGSAPSVRAESNSTSAAVVVIQSGSGDAVDVTGKTKTTNLQVTDGGGPLTGMVLHSVDDDGNAVWGYVNDVTCLMSLYRGTNALGNISFAPLDAPVQVPLDLTTTPLPTGYICSSDWDRTSTLGGFTPTKNLDRSGTTTDGVTAINVHFRATIPGGWTNSTVGLWIDKNGTPEEIGRVFVVAGTGATKFHISGTYYDRFTGTDTYKVYVSQDVAGAPNTLTSWAVKVTTAFQHTADCSACTS